MSSLAIDTTTLNPANPPWEGEGALPTFEYRGLYMGGWPNPIQVESFDPGSADWRAEDSQNAAGDGGFMGRNLLDGSTWALELFTDAANDVEALALEAEVARRWMAEEVRHDPWRVEPLRYYMAGRWRRVYGRPRRYAGSDGGGVLTRRGVARMSLDFRTVDHLYYDDVEKHVEATTVPATVGGFTFPVTFPLITAHTEGARTNQFRVGGTFGTWPRVTVYGPITDARVVVGDWSLRLRGTLAYDQSLAIDTAPWARTAIRNDGASAAGLLHPATRLSGLALQPGYHEVRLEGVDLTGTARVRIAWRDAYHSI